MTTNRPRATFAEHQERMKTQTDDVLRSYPEYEAGAQDKRDGVASRHYNYLLLDPDGRFAKKAYLLGYRETLGGE